MTTTKLTGITYRRKDNRLDGRIIAANNRVVGTTGNQGYRRRPKAERVLRYLLCDGPHIVIDHHGVTIPPTPDQEAEYAAVPLRLFRRRRRFTGRVYRRLDGRFEWRIMINGRTVFVSHSQGFENAGDALSILTSICHGGPHRVRPAPAR